MTEAEGKRTQQFRAARATGSLESEGPPPSEPAVVVAAPSQPQGPCKHAITGPCEACDLVALMLELGFRGDAHMVDLVRGMAASADRHRIECEHTRATIRAIGMLATSCPIAVPSEAIRLLIHRDVLLVQYAALEAAIEAPGAAKVLGK